MKKILLFIVLFFSFASSANALGAALVMDADSGRVLYGINQNTRYLIASTTKIMTALVVLNYSDSLDRVVEVGEEVLSAYGSSIYLKPREKLTIRDLLYGLLLRSGNELA